MRAWLVVAPWWVRGVAFAAVMVPFTGVIGTLSFHYGSHHTRPWSVSIYVGLAMGVLFGGALAAGAAWAARSRPVAPELRVLSPEQRIAALRALRRGTAPADPWTRAAALDVAWRSLRQGRDRRRTVAWLTGSAVAIILSVQLIEVSVSGLVAAALGLWSLVVSLLEPRRLRRRIAVLQGEPAVALR